MIFSLNVETYLAGVLIPLFSDLEVLSPILVFEEIIFGDEPFFYHYKGFYTPKMMAF